MPSHKLSFFLRAACALAVLTSAACAAGSILVVAVNNGEGTTDGPSYSAFSNPVLNEAGQAAFVGFRVQGEFGQPDLAGGIYVGDGLGPLIELIRVGDPGFVPNSFANSFTVQAINDAGQVACLERALSADGTTLASGLLLRAPATDPTLVVKTGDPDPDGDPITQINFTDLDAKGRVGLTLSHPKGLGSIGLTSTAVFEAAGLRVLAKLDRPAPDGIGTVGATFFPAVNNAGQIHYSPRIIRPGLPERPVLFRESPGIGRELLFRSEDATTSPAIDGTLLLEEYTPSMNESGLVVFAGNVSGATNPANNGRGLFVVDAPNAVRAMVREGQDVPAGDTIIYFGRPSLNESGAASFYALLTDDPEADLNRDNVGLYRQSSAGLTEVARDGQPAPTGGGMIDLPRFVLTTIPSLHTRPMFNDNGQVAFLANVINTSSDSTTNKAIFFFDDTLGLAVIARTGDPLLDSPIVDLGLRQSNRSDGDEEIGFNDAGQIAFRFALADDREGVAIWSPDPTATTIMLAITRTTAPAAGYDLAWDSRPGKVYDLITWTDLITPLDQWPVHASYGDISAIGTSITLTAVPADGPQRFFVVIEKDAPPAN
jgi:hypothetical protein